MRKDTPLKTITGTWIYATDKAFQFQVTRISDFPIPVPKTVWFPFSQSEKLFRDPSAIGKDTALVSEWILEKNGFSDPEDDLEDDIDNEGGSI